MASPFRPVENKLCGKGQEPATNKFSNQTNRFNVLYTSIDTDNMFQNASPKNEATTECAVKTTTEPQQFEAADGGCDVCEQPKENDKEIHDQIEDVKPITDELVENFAGVSSGYVFVEAEDIVEDIVDHDEEETANEIPIQAVTEIVVAPESVEQETLPDSLEDVNLLEIEPAEVKPADPLPEPETVLPETIEEETPRESVEVVVNLPDAEPVEVEPIVTDSAIVEPLPEPPVQQPVPEPCIDIATVVAAIDDSSDSEKTPEVDVPIARRTRSKAQSKVTIASDSLGDLSFTKMAEKKIPSIATQDQLPLSSTPSKSGQIPKQEVSPPEDPAIVTPSGSRKRPRGGAIGALKSFLTPAKASKTPSGATKTAKTPHSIGKHLGWICGVKGGDLSPPLEK